MPNHVINEITLHGVKLEDVRQHLLNTDGRLSFGVLLPLPLNFWAGSVGKDHEEAFPGTHLDAASQTWGTKWDAYGDPKVEETEGGVFITFQSAWSHPRGWTCALFNTVKCQITAKWLSEGFSSGWVEKYSVEDRHGDVSWLKEEIKEGTDEHRRLHKRLWGVEELPPEDADD